MELLVVIAVLSVLLAFTVVALGTAKTRTARGACMGNQRQLAIAWQVYSGDHNESLVSNDPNSLQAIPPTWVIGFLDYAGSNSYNSQDEYVTGDKRSLLGPYMGSPKLVRCALDRSMVRLGDTALPRVRTVAMNAFIGENKHGLAGVPFQNFRKTADLVLAPPAGLFVFIEQLEDSIDDAHFWLPMGFPERWEDYPGTAHGNGAVLSFSDGSVAFHKWADAQTPSNYQGSKRAASDAKGSRDVRWLQSRNTSATLTSP